MQVLAPHTLAALWYQLRGASHLPAPTSAHQGGRGAGHGGRGVGAAGRGAKGLPVEQVACSPAAAAARCMRREGGGGERTLYTANASSIMGEKC